MRSEVLLLSVCFFLASLSYAQNVGIGTATPGVRLDVNGAFTHRDTTLLITGNTVIPTNNHSQVQLNAGTVSAPFTITPAATLSTGEVLVVFNNTAYTATLGSTPIPAGVAIQFVYTSGGWVATAPASSGSSTYIQNQTSSAQTGAGFNTAGSGTIGTTLSVGGDATISGGSLTFANSASNFILYPGAGVGIPAFTTRSVGTRIVLWPQLDASDADYAEGISSSTLWHSVPQATSTYVHAFYGGTTELMRIQGNGYVGIGTATPADVLEVNGSVRLSAGAAHSLYIPNQPAGTSGNDLTLQAGGTVGFSSYATAGGNVHITAGNTNSAGSQNGGNIIFQTGLNYWNNGINPGALHGDFIVQGGVAGGSNTTTQEWMRVNGTTGAVRMENLTGTATRYVTTDLNGNLSASTSSLKATQVWTENSTLPGASSFTTSGGTILICASGSGYSSTASVIGMNILIDGVNKGTAKSFTNETGSHKTFTASFLVVTGLAAGSHTVQLTLISPTTTDYNDFFSLSTLELPF